MHARAPGKSAALQEGHVVGADEGRRIGAGVAAVAGVAGAATADEEARGAVRAILDDAAVRTVSRTGAAPTAMAFLHPGQITCLPEALSGTCIACVQNGHRITCGIPVSFGNEYEPTLPNGDAWAGRRAGGSS